MEEQREEIIHLNKQALPYIQQFLQGDSRAFHSLVQLFGHRIRGIIRKMVYSHHDTEDIQNEIWLKVAQNLHRFDQSLPFHTWVYRLASNACIDFLRKKREMTMEDDQLHLHVNKATGMQADDPESLLLKKERKDILEKLLSQLDETDRLIVTLRFSEELSYEEIGGIVGMSKNTVGTRLFRARKQLKSLFEQNPLERRMLDASY